MVGAHLEDSFAPPFLEAVAEFPLLAELAAVEHSLESEAAVANLARHQLAVHRPNSLAPQLLYQLRQQPVRLSRK